MALTSICVSFPLLVDMLLFFTCYQVVLLEYMGARVLTVERAAAIVPRKELAGTAGNGPQTLQKPTGGAARVSVETY